MKIFGLKTITLVAVMLVSLVTFAGTTTKLTVDQRATMRMQKVNAVCNLTAQQQVQVKQFYMNSINAEKSFKSARKNEDKSDRMAARKSALSTKAHYQNSLKELLTPDQYSKWINSKKKK
jgi:hypothetical protein